MKTRYTSTTSASTAMSEYDIRLPSLKTNLTDQTKLPSQPSPAGSAVSSSTSKTSLTSYKVFAEFFTPERILSKDCYIRWLETRKGKLLHPEGSFRRTVLAHLRGADGRKPFPPDVERSLLKKLRERDASDRLLNPWRVCFNEDDTANEGCRKRFTALGYHEGKAKKLNKKHEGQGMTPMSVSSMSAGNQTPYAYHQTPSPYGYHTMQANKNAEEETEVFSRLVNHDSDNLNHKLRVAEMHKVNVCMPAVSYLLNNLGAEDERLARDFIFPSPSECYFQQNMAIFELNLNGLDWIVNYGDEHAARLFGDVAGQHLSTFFPSLVEFFNIARLAQEVVQGQKGRTTPGGTPQGLPANMPPGMAEGMLAGLPEGMLGGLPEGMLGGMPQGMQGGMPPGMSAASMAGMAGMAGMGEMFGGLMGGEGNEEGREIWIRARCVGLENRAYSCLCCVKLGQDTREISVLGQDQTHLFGDQQETTKPPLLV